MRSRRCFGKDNDQTERAIASPRTAAGSGRAHATRSFAFWQLCGFKACRYKINYKVQRSVANLWDCLCSCCNRFRCRRNSSAPLSSSSGCTLRYLGIFWTHFLDQLRLLVPTRSSLPCLPCPPTDAASKRIPPCLLRGLHLII